MKKNNSKLFKKKKVSDPSHIINPINVNQPQCSSDIISTSTESPIVSIEPRQPLIDFPIDKNNRKFLPVWYKNYAWLDYDFKKNKAFCIACKLFPASRANMAFTVDGYSNWKNEVTNFINHQNSPEHHISFDRWTSRVLKSQNVLIY